MTNQTKCRPDQSPDPDRWYKLVMEQEAADKKAMDEAEKKIRKKLRQKGKKLEQERLEQERIEQEKLEEINEEKRRAQAKTRWTTLDYYKARMETRTKKAILDAFKYQDTPEGHTRAAIVTEAFSDKRSLSKAGMMLKGLRVLRTINEEDKNWNDTGKNWDAIILAKIEEEVRKGVERGEHEAEKLKL